MEHLLYYGNTRRLTDEELANAVHLDPSQIAGMGPSLDAIRQMLEERKRKILETYETAKAQERAGREFKDQARSVRPPDKLRKRFDQAVQEEQLYDLENLYYLSGGDNSPFARDIVLLTESLGRKYQVDELAAKYEFTGREKMTVDEALQIKQELEMIDKLLQQIEEAMKTAQIGLIDMEELGQFVEGEQLDNLRQIMERINEYLKHQAEEQGLQKDRRGYQITPKAYRLFQNKLLSMIFSELQQSKTGKHEAVVGEGATEIERTKPYEFGDSVAQMDIPASMINALLRNGPGSPVRMGMEDIVIHQTRNTPKCATCVLLDMSGSMRYDGLYVNVKKMGLALDGLIRKEYPGDFLQFIEMYTFAKPRHISEVPALMYKPVTIFDPVVKIKADMSDPDITEMQIPPHFTNIQHALQLGRRFLCSQDTPNKQIFLVTDGLPTAHFEGEILFMLYPPNNRTEEATMREAMLCAREGITINIFLLNSWNQTSEDVKFAYRMAETTKGRVIFTAGKELDRFVVWDYIKRRKSIIS
jgi:uncharacterized protein with von Willebrand factor type A (vWA) domain